MKAARTIEMSKQLTRDQIAELALKRLVCDHVDNHGECIICGETLKDEPLVKQ